MISTRIMLTGFVAVFALAACAANPGGASQAGSGQGLCDFEVSSAEAWVNRMPTVGEARRPQLSVVVQINDDGKIRRLQMVQFGGGQLRLAVAPGKAPLTPGVLTWRMHEPEGGIDRIDIVCESDVVASIETIESVY